MATIFIYLLLCLIIGLIGVNRKFGYWGYFFCSLFLTPVIGAIILLGSDERRERYTKCPNCSYPLSEIKAENRIEKHNLD